MSTGEQAIVRRARRYLAHAGARSRIALWQLPTIIAVLLVALASPASWADPAARPLVVASIVVLGVACVGALALPWDRLPDQLVLAVPVLDLVALGLMRNASAALQGIAALAIFPIIWIAASMRSALWALLVSFTAPLVMTLPSLIQAFAHGTPAGANSSIFLAVLLLAVAVAIRAATTGLHLQERELRAQRARLRRLLLESQSTERLLAAILEAVSVGIVAVDSYGTPVRTNRRFRELVSPFDLPAAAPVDADLQLYARDHRTPLAPLQQQLERAAQGERIDGEVMWLGEGSDSAALSVSSRAVDGPRGGAVVAFADVTALANAAEDKAELVRTVAHEFRSPLTAVLGNVDLVLESESLASDDRLRLDVAQRSAERLLELATDLVASSSHSVPIRLEHADVGAVVSARAEAARLTAVAAGVQLAVEVGEPLWARADPLRVGQVIDNLLSNAIKYSPDGGTVTLRGALKDGWITVEVRDSGMGIPSHERQRVFERFFRTSQARRSDIPGVGLGLAISSWIAERHGGGLACESQPGRGSVFTLTLPVAGPA
ncbi:PAS domain-containing sensor histidine kinase [Sinomonas sp. ASV322]|uniref:sensor histidine kinase n=1 Tax=Sinomonas sp. ASV322 TaxID=3041920 RepID=UPI0027DC06DA|nr:PAS domain-containing sensor histidine kinase [Sinomonas sp. ASV322]MDQ4501861.1 PAS domain-containing sensor histidine kinase [Sinomonas sp. ASV322]